MPELIEDAQRAFTAYTVERELGSGGMATVYPRIWLPKKPGRILISAVRLP